MRMKTEYKHYTEITKEILDNIKVGMLVKINDWKRPMKVVGVSENYFCMIQKVCGKISYSVCEKKPWGGIRHNSMRGGMFHCGTDNMIFGYLGFDYKFDDKEQIKYKPEWNGRSYIKIGKFVPTSQICNICGYKNPDIKNLSIRKWICPKCGNMHDRDINAAKNILNEGLKQIA